MDAALDHFAIDVSGLSVLDAGASTGGFTDCLLQRGASKVVALDVGHGQLHERLRSDPRVMLVERTNLRHVRLDHVGGEAFRVLVADLSFISLTAVAPALMGHLAAPAADLVVLVKPQFEAGRTEASRGKGVIRDPVIWRRVLSQVTTTYQAAGAAMMGAMVSPITGTRGNVEFLLHLRVTPSPPDLVLGPSDLDELVAEAAAQVMG